jgi:hypothetical protein
MRPPKAGFWRALLGAVGIALALPSLAAGQPFERTELREDCLLHEPLRRPWFGDLHIHTSHSFDAYLFETRNEPRDTHAFAKGAPLGLAPLDPQGNPTRQTQLLRPLDFAAATDHAELLGEASICTTPGHPSYDSPACQIFRNDPNTAFTLFGLGLATTPPDRLGLCGENDLLCLLQAASVWSDIQGAAEEHYDRSASCGFTTFNAYEWTGSPGGDNLHRNVIFRNANVPFFPFSYFEASQPEALWSGLEEQCVNSPSACDVLSIPHNSNLSNGRTFDPLGSNGLPMTGAEAFQRRRIEPLTEVVQHKGDSECRFGVGNNDELCDFEKLATLPPALDAPLSYARNALLEGLAVESSAGFNPFAFGLIGSTDTHNGTAGASREDTFVGHAGDRDDTPEGRLSGGLLLNNPGGLAVVWAEENSRDALFTAMRRREVYATTGTRPEVRFFGGFSYPLDLCDAADFAAQGYASGVPMGGAIGPAAGAAPRFAVSALQDPGAIGGAPATPLQRIQIVKGWLDSNGTREAVYDVAGSTDNGAGLDLATCTTSGSSFASLCTVWEDPDFDPSQPAFYYARVLENESCRWNRWTCVAAGVDCSTTPPAGFEACCDPSVPKTLQERAYTSPIWYQPAPEPGRALLLLAGVAGLGALRRAS